MYLNFGYYNFEQGGLALINKVLVFYFTCQAMFLLGASSINDSKKQNVILVFTLLSIIYCLYISYSSFSLGYRGYAQLYDPINRIDINSPLIAMMLTLNSIVFLEAFLKKEFKIKISFFVFLFFIFIAVFISGFYLSSRASLVLISVYLFFCFFRIKGTVLVIVFSFCFLSFISTLIYHDLAINFSLGGFEDRGIDSPRFEMLEYGLNNLYYYPFGGMRVISSTYDGIWFHNMFLDIVRVSGWVTMIVWLCISIYFFTQLLRGRKWDTLAILSILYLALLQDLAFDGFYNLMMLVFFFFGSSLSEYRRYN
ncbi:hypothetical protein BCT90_09985 [Vibrio lentus]|nr:hypothetical protein BCT90_09985 [Vibrio lentus]